MVTNVVLKKYSYILKQEEEWHKHPKHCTPLPLLLLLTESVRFISSPSGVHLALQEEVAMHIVRDQLPKDVLQSNSKVCLTGCFLRVFTAFWLSTVCHLVQPFMTCIWFTKEINSFLCRRRLLIKSKILLTRVDIT